MTPTQTPYLTTREAVAVARRIEKKGLLNPDWWVQLLPVTLPESEHVHFVLRYFVTEDAEEPVALVHFLRGGDKLSKSAEFIDQLVQVLKITWGVLTPNFMLVRKLPTLANTRRYKLQLLVN